MDVAPTVSAILNLPPPAQAKGSPIHEITADLTGVSRVAVLALDAFGVYAWNLWRDKMPCLDALHALHSIRLRSVMPSITPVNFATIVTGTDLHGHGINTRKDNFTCETLFDVVRKAGGRSAGVGLSGYTGSELLGRCADIWGNAGKGSDDDVADKIMEIAGNSKPDFLIAQFGRVDDIFHKHGPSSPEIAPMLEAADERLRRLIGNLKPLGYGILILADHGQHDVPAGKQKGAHGTDQDEDCLVPCTWTA
jgi:predicted AlkP superfamily pyrophosphatase or phosphodiesterase